MAKPPTGFTTIDEYIATFPTEIQTILQEIRAAIREVVPDAEEKISYQMPTFYLHGNLVHFAAFKNHIGFYPTPTGIEAFQERLSQYKGAKGSVQFPLDQPMPLDLIRDITKFRVDEAIQRKGRAKT
ncbi:MAG: DUF1801 domain-containing protein [Caldilineaceae bacterium]|nr:DUF1801 domain-containing protein [Caldilineaceae bacterium]